MTESIPTGAPQVDMGRVVHRATQAAASALGDLAVQLGVTQEGLEIQTARGNELQRQVAELTETASTKDRDHVQALAEKDAELARLRVANDQLTRALAARGSADSGATVDGEQSALPPAPVEDAPADI